MLSTTKSRLITSGKKLLLILSSCFLVLNSSFAQPAIQWQKCLGGTSNDLSYSIQQTSDGGYVIAGRTDSNNGDVTGNHGIGDYWIVKLDGGGNLQWQKCLGGTGTDVAYSVQQTVDGGYVVAGNTSSLDGDVTGNHGFVDCWIVKLDGSGNIQWQKCLGGTIEDRTYSVQQTADGGYVIAGYTFSNDGDVTGNHGSADSWVVKLDGSGNVQWQKCLGGTNDDRARYVRQTADGGYVVACYSNSNDGDVTGNHSSSFSDYWVVKLDGSGNVQWQKCLGGTDNDAAYAIEQTADGGYVVAGDASSNDGDVAGNHGDRDYWVVKLDSSGNIQWQKCLGGTSFEYTYSVKQTADGGYVIAGQTNSNDGDVIGNHGGFYDYWVVKLDSSGNIQWQKCMGGTNIEYAYSVQLTSDGGYVVTGSTYSNDGDVTGNHSTGIYDYWVVKLSPLTGIEEEINNGTYNIYPNPFTTHAVISFGSPVHNATFSVFNLLGEKVAEVFNINGESFQFNRGNLPSGVYVFEVREKGKNIGRGKAVVY